MKLKHVFVILLAMIVFAALHVGWDYHKVVQANGEFLRIRGIAKIIEDKLQSYHQTNGSYPKSLDRLTFTNTLEEPQLVADVKNFRYRTNDTGEYSLGYGSTFSFSFSSAETNHDSNQ